VIIGQEDVPLKLKYNTRKTCLICSSPVKEIVDLGLHSFADTFIPRSQRDLVEPIFPLVCQLCSECSLVQLKHCTSDQARYNLYPYSYTSSNSDYSRSHWQLFSELISKRNDTKKSFVLEIGSNDGYLLSLLKDHVSRAIGYDSSKEMTKIARDRGIEVYQESFDGATAKKICARHGRAEFVIANNVVNHSNDPVDFVRGVKTVLADGGVFIFEVPYWLETVRSLHFDQIYHEHVTYFTVRSIVELLKKAELEISNITLNDYHGGSLRVEAVHASGSEHSSCVDSFMAQEAELRLANLNSYIDYFANIKLKRSRFMLELLTLINANPRAQIVGVGAAAKANTLITFYGLNSSLLSFITDASPFKVGKYTPLTRVPILGDDAICGLENVIAIILSWNISDSLKNRILNLNNKVQFVDL